MAGNLLPFPVVNLRAVAADNAAPDPGLPGYAAGAPVIPACVDYNPDAPILDFGNGLLHVRLHFVFLIEKGSV